MISTFYLCHLFKVSNILFPLVLGSPMRWAWLLHISDEKIEAREDKQLAQWYSAK